MKALLLLECFPACGFRYFDLAVGLVICYFGFTKLQLDGRINLSRVLLTGPIFFLATFISGMLYGRQELDGKRLLRAWSPWVGGGAEHTTRTPTAPQLRLAPELGSRIFERNGTIRLEMIPQACFGGSRAFGLGKYHVLQPS